MLEQAKKLKDQGLSYRQVAKELGSTHTTIREILNPELREKNRLKYKFKCETDPHFKKYKRVKPKTAEEIAKKEFRSRCKYSLKQARTKAKRDGYQPCITSVDELVKSFTGFCQICLIPEAKCSKKLSMDHCHKTGKFRGWICNKCNMGLGCLENHLVQAIHYLKEDK
jgi:hypothetical protein